MPSCAENGCEGKGRELDKPKQDCDSKETRQVRAVQRRAGLHTFDREIRKTKLKEVVLEFAVKEVMFQ